MNAHTNDARAEILARLGRALDRPGAGVYVSSTSRQLPGSPPPQTVPRSYIQRSTLDNGALRELLTDRLVDYRAHVHQADSATVAEVVAGLVRQASAVVVPDDLEQAVLTGVRAAGLPVLADSVHSPLSVDELNQPGLSVITSSTVSIAQTGTIVLAGSPGCGRRAISLVPDHHVCVIQPGTIVELVPEAITRLADSPPGAPWTMISGPSATSDIELNRVEGVHGPRRLDVVLLSA